MLRFTILSIIIISMAIREIKASSAIPTISKLTVEQIKAGTSLNNNCKVNGSICSGNCINGRKCEWLRNFDEPFCGCLSCAFNTRTSKCEGQCSNLLLQSCLSIIPVPKKSSDCVCIGCSASQKEVIEQYDLYDPVSQQIKTINTATIETSVDCSTCNPPSPSSSSSRRRGCFPHYVAMPDMGRQRFNDTAYCSCNALY